MMYLALFCSFGEENNAIVKAWSFQKKLFQKKCWLDYLQLCSLGKLLINFKFFVYKTIILETIFQ